MKTAVTFLILLALPVGLGCSMSPRGGGMGSGEGFTISVPAFDQFVKQGETETMKVTLHRGDYFKQNVRLEIKAPEAIIVKPTDVVVKADQEPSVQLEIKAPKETPLGNYRVYVKGIPETGESTMVEFTVKVVSP